MNTWHRQWAIYMVSKWNVVITIINSVEKNNTDTDTGTLSRIAQSYRYRYM